MKFLFHVHTSSSLGPCVMLLRNLAKNYGKMKRSWKCLLKSPTYKNAGKRKIVRFKFGQSGDSPMNPKRCPSSKQNIYANLMHRTSYKVPLSKSMKSKMTTFFSRRLNFPLKISIHVCHPAIFASELRASFDGMPLRGID